MSDPQELEERINELIEFISAANQEAKGGNMVELGNLDDKVSALCKEIETLEPEDAKTMQPLMGNMISRLDELAESLTELQNIEEGQL